LPYSGGEALGCELARQAVCWALLAHRALGAEPADVSPSDRGLEALWSSSDQSLLTRAAGSAAQLERLKTDLFGKSFIEFATLDRGAQVELASRLHAFVLALLEPLDTVQRELERIWLRAAFRIACMLALLVGLAALGFEVRDYWQQRSDRALSANWTTSSQYDTCACTSPAQSCAECPDYFFHTREEREPWVLFDFGSTESLSGVVVENRRDCCTERGLPLVVEVSPDKVHWTEVARRSSEFSTWRQTFPTVNARWVRLRVPHQAILHLARVRLLP